MSDYLDPNNEELLKDFFDEAQHQVELFEQNILALENNPANAEAVDEIFRAAHTLKGAAATVQMNDLTEFTHTVEDVLDRVREGEVRVTSDIVDTLLGSIDVIKGMLDAQSRSEAYDGDAQGLAQRLKALAGTEAVKSSTPSSAATGGAPAERARSSVGPGVDTGLSEYELLEMQESAEDNEAVYRVTVTFDENNPMNTVGGIQVYATLKEIGSVAKSTPDFEKLYEDVFYPRVEYYLVSSARPQEIAQTVTITDVTVASEIHRLDAEEAEFRALETTQAGGDEPSPEGRTESPVRDRALEQLEPPQDATPRQTPPPSGARQRTGGGSILRVDSRRIDDLLNLVSEAVINKATFNQIAQVFAETQDTLQEAEDQFQDRIHSLMDELPELAAESAAGRKADSAFRTEVTAKIEEAMSSYRQFGAELKAAVNQFKNTAQNLGRITGELQEGVMQIRMVPISQIFSRFPRLVRDVSKNLNKQIELTVEGEETELDKSVIEDLLDPLIHCVRNAVDHGIESLEQRRDAGKDPVGHVFLRANNEGNLIVIEISDDGKGIDVQRVRERAIERKLIHPSKQLSDLEAFGLIFEPGFSTARKVTDISGRGVGLDVVKKQIERLNGNVTVWSELGAGTKITIKLPLTLAILQGLLVRVGHEVYAIPITSVLESHRIKTEEIGFLDNYEVMNVREEVISLLRLDRLFKIPTDENRRQHFIVIVGSEEKKVGLIVDSLIGEEDVVIKPLRDRFVSSPGVAGATILGDGKVALIIDVSQLLDLGMEREQAERREQARSIV